MRGVNFVCYGIVWDFDLILMNYVFIINRFSLM